MNPLRIPLDVRTKVALDCGRWVVYLCVDYWDEGSRDNPIETVFQKLSDFSTRELAQKAASIYQRTVDRHKNSMFEDENGIHDA